MITHVFQMIYPLPWFMNDATGLWDLGVSGGRDGTVDDGGGTLVTGATVAVGFATMCEFTVVAVFEWGRGRHGEAVVEDLVEDSWGVDREGWLMKTIFIIHIKYLYDITFVTTFLKENLLKSLTEIFLRTS